MNRKRPLVSRFRVVALASAIAFTVVQPAQALFGVGDIVLDPSNLAQNVLTAARTLEQINNQIAQLQNEAQMLINQARNLANLPYSALQQIQPEDGKVDTLVMCHTRELAFQIEEQFSALGASIGLRQAVVVGGLGP